MPVNYIPSKDELENTELLNQLGIFIIRFTYYKNVLLAAGVGVHEIGISKNSKSCTFQEDGNVVLFSK